MQGLYRRNGKKVYIKQPEFNEMEYVSELWSDRETMEGIGGVFDFSRNKWEPFYRKMVSPSDGKNFYCLIYNNKDIPVGEVSFHGYDLVTKTARFNIKVHSKYREMGYGREAINLMLEYYFQEFGGNIMMDTIKNEKGIELAKKFNFEQMGKARDGFTFRITKENFFTSNKGAKKHVGILILEEMSVLDYAMPFELLSKANEIAKDEIFNVYGISFVDEVKMKSNAKLKIKKEIEINQNPNIIIIPGGFDSLERSKKVIDYLLQNYNECDYICALEDGINYLVKCKELNGIVVPQGKFLEKLSNEERDSLRIINKNYTDNGKIMLSKNIMGTLELCLSLIKKVCGREIEEKLYKEVGIR
ncbi:MAG: GNAT family N-acetyltransferase [Clostridium sp.]|uniref:GNAT family N-acetyltransferase n=1 Tax=Clostridium sp. TaxID=1506 RepID=UPI003EE80126